MFYFSKSETRFCCAKNCSPELPIALTRLIHKAKKRAFTSVANSLFLTTIFFLELSACTAPTGPARVMNYLGPAGVAFPGLLPSIEDRVSQRYIFQIHGINTTDPNWGESLLSEIPRYGYTRDRVPGPVDPTGQPPTRVGQITYWNPAKLAKPKIVIGQGLNCNNSNRCLFNHFGVYREDVFVNSKTGDHVTVFTYFWRDDLWRINGQYLDADIAANNTHSWTPNTQKSLINASLKGGLMDNGFSDAVGYLSAMGSLEREGIESTLCAMFADAIGTADARNVAPGKGCLEKLEAKNHLNPNSVEFDFLSHSLGSRMLYDVLSPIDPDTNEERTSEANEARSFIATRTRTFFMAANQLPLLALSGVVILDASRTQTASAAGTSSEPDNFFDLRDRKLESTSKFRPSNSVQPSQMSSDLSIVAFQDPDDLLGFKASDAVINDPQQGLHFIDIVHRNTPQILFLLAWPTTAHDHELVEPNSLKMILCGATIDVRGNLTAQKCRS